MTRAASLCVVSAVVVLALAFVGLVVGDFPVPVRSAIATAIWDRGGEFDFVINSLRFPRGCGGRAGRDLPGHVRSPVSGAGRQPAGVPRHHRHQQRGRHRSRLSSWAIGLDSGYMPYAAIAGALVAGALVFLLAWRRGFSGARLVLVGIGLNALLGAVVAYMLVGFPVERVNAAAFWQAGTLSSSSWSDARTLAIGVAVLVPAAFFLIPRLRIIQLGDEKAVTSGCASRRAASRQSPSAAVWPLWWWPPSAPSASWHCWFPT